jgi:glycosyltransferase involved in cell wall biosynthesis
VTAEGRADVTVCVPAFEAEAFVGDCLEAARSQTHERIAVHVSVNASADATEAVCREFESDSRFRVHVHRQRLGWVGNVNFPLDRVETDLFCILPHDDLLEPDYVAVLRDALATAPDAVVAYADVATFGAVRELRSVPGLDAPLVKRALALLASPTEGVPFAGSRARGSYIAACACATTATPASGPTSSGCSSCFVAGRFAT